MPRGPYILGETFIGQRSAMAFVVRLLHGAMSRGEPMDPVLFTGPSGMGKSLAAQTLSTLARAEHCYKFHGNQRLVQVVEKLLLAKPFDYYFLDEAHALGHEVQLALYQVIDSGVVAVPAKLHKPGTPETFRLPPITPLFATDQPGLLLPALFKRIYHEVEFRRYDVDEMREIVARVAKKEKILLTPQAARQLANVSNGMPRRAEHHVRKLKYFTPDSETKDLGKEHVLAYFRAMGTDEDGLGRRARQYLRFVGKHRGGVALEVIAAYLGTDVDYVRREVEQPLRFRGLSTVGRAGRTLTKKGQLWLEQYKEDRRQRTARKTRERGED